MMIKYNPPINLRFDEQEHLYYDADTNELLTGTTTILKVKDKPALIQWASNSCAEYFKEHFTEITKENFEEHFKQAKVAYRKISNKAKDTGSDAHKFIEDWLKDKLDRQIDAEIAELAQNLPFSGDIEAQNCIKCFCDFYNAYKPIFRASEMMIGSAKHKFAGTLDFLAEINGELVLGDFKTSTGIFPDYHLQLAGYQICLEEGGVVPAKRLIVRLAKKGDYEAMYSPSPLEFDKEVFLHLRETHKWNVWWDNYYQNNK